MRNKAVVATRNSSRRKSSGSRLRTRTARRPITASRTTVIAVVVTTKAEDLKQKAAKVKASSL